MAERRMFAKAIVQSARFLKMPVSSRELYFQLGMAADDDGMVEAWNVMRLTNAREDDLRVLMAKGYIQVLDNEDYIAYLTDWETNNTIRKDRYHPGAYKDLKIRIQEGLLLNDNQVTTNCQPTDNQTTPEIRLGKVKLGKDKDIGEKRKRFVPPTLEEITTYCKERNNNVDPKKFFDYYQAGEWKDAKGNPVKNWKQKLITWERKDTAPKSKPKFNDYPQSDIDYDELSKKIFAN